MSLFGLDSSTLTIVCSDASRNGKTLLSKLVADTCYLRYGVHPKIYETGPRSVLGVHFPAKTRVIDLSHTPDQVLLFDSVLSASSDTPPNNHFLVDLSSDSLPRFFDLFFDIDFASGASEAGVSVYVLFIVDRVISSIECAVRLRSLLSDTKFVPVRNTAIGDALDAPGGSDLYSELGEHEILLPELSGEALGYLEHPEFHFDSFLAGRYDNLSFFVGSELTGFLEAVYEQRAKGSVI